ncbi:hypothetical protein [Psychroflexus tropicus]|uniref:hypothetical protein n=1 Tax=Psychroflexus tropicus TaxID=197345 RepID=UPI0003A808E0|nr:hypothetical protein [Psychroflexus tropicus]
MIKIDTIHSGGGRSGETATYSGHGELWGEPKAFLSGILYGTHLVPKSIKTRAK